MEISFGSQKLKKTCESQSALQAAHGQGCARKTMTRLADLRAVSSLAEMRALPGHCHELSADRAGQLAVDLPDGKRLIFEPATDPPPVKDDGGLDWSAVRSIRILAIENYHRG